MSQLPYGMASATSTLMNSSTVLYQLLSHPVHMNHI